MSHSRNRGNSKARRKEASKRSWERAQARNKRRALANNQRARNNAQIIADIRTEFPAVFAAVLPTSTYIDNRGRTKNISKTTIVQRIKRFHLGTFNVNGAI